MPLGSFWLGVSSDFDLSGLAGDTGHHLRIPGGFLRGGAGMGWGGGFLALSVTMAAEVSYGILGGCSATVEGGAFIQQPRNE